MNYQILGNCDVLIHMTHQSSKNDSDMIVPVDGDGNILSQQPVSKPVFQENQINALIKNPVKLALGRINGLRKAIDNLESQIKEKVSTGKKE